MNSSLPVRCAHFLTLTTGWSWPAYRVTGLIGITPTGPKIRHTGKTIGPGTHTMTTIIGTKIIEINIQEVGETGEIIRNQATIGRCVILWINIVKRN